MSDEFDTLQVTRKTGTEKFLINGAESAFALADFWGWSTSDLMNNSLRGMLAEFIVATAIGTDLKNTHRVEWDAYDLISNEGVKIEVKSSAYLQSWKQTKLSAISFEIHPTFGYNDDKGKYEDETKRQADVYVFCVLKHKDRLTVNPLDLGQWDFYIISSKVLNEKVGNQKSIGLSSLLKLKPIFASYNEISKAIHIANRFYAEL